MAKKTKSTDVNVTAFEILNSLVEEPPILPVILAKKKKAPPAKNPAAVALGRLGGMKGGKARAKKLSAKQRKDIAKKAAKTRWSKRSKLS